MKAKHKHYVVRCMQHPDARALFIRIDMRDVYPAYWLKPHGEVSLSDWTHAILAGCKLAGSPTAAMEVTSDLYKRIRRG